MSERAQVIELYLLIAYMYIRNGVDGMDVCDLRVYDGEFTGPHLV